MVVKFFTRHITSGNLACPITVSYAVYFNTFIGSYVP